MAKKNVNKIYGPSEEALENNVRVQIPFDLSEMVKPRNAKKEEEDKPVRLIWVGVGGDCKINRKAPKKSVVVKEATPTQYEWMYKSGRFAKLVVAEDAPAVAN